MTKSKGVGRGFRIPIDIETRYYSKVDASGGPETCHPWTATTNDHGYGQFWDGTYRENGQPRMVSAHRWAYKRFVGDPEELHVRHTCDNPKCHNPAHWILGTHQQNMNDRHKRGRTVLADVRGVRNGHAIVNDEIVREIRCRAAAGEYHRVIGLDVGLTREAVGLIVRRINWKHVQ